MGQRLAYDMGIRPASAHGGGGGGPAPSGVTVVETAKLVEGGQTTIPLVGPFLPGDVAVVISFNETPVWTVTGSGATPGANQGAIGGPDIQTLPITTGDTAIVASSAPNNMALCMVVRGASATITNGTYGAGPTGPTITSEAGGIICNVTGKTGSSSVMSWTSWAAVPGFSFFAEGDAFGPDAYLTWAYGATEAAESTAGATHNAGATGIYAFNIAPAA